MSSLTIATMVAGLEQYAGRYHALDVFAKDLAEYQALCTGQSLPGITKTGHNSFVVHHKAGQYELRLFPELGVVRIAPVAEGGTEKAALLGGAVGAGLGVALTDKADRASGVVAGLVLGLLVGAALGENASGSGAPSRRVLALAYDDATQSWYAYDGNLVRWVKERLAAPAVLAGLPR
jgi:hypothetical protein